MNVKTMNGRQYFYQWDTGQTLIVEDVEKECEVHFGRRGDQLAIVCAVRPCNGKYVADVPNILLQQAGSITAYLFFRHTDGTETCYAKEFRVLHRPKPETYIYTQTESLNYSDLRDRLVELEKSLSDDQIVKVIEQYLADRPMETVDVSWDEIKDRPFGDNVDVLLEPTEFTFHDYNGVPVSFVVEEGETYTIVVDGVAYTATPTFDYDMTDIWLPSSDFAQSMICPVFFVGCFDPTDASYIPNIYEIRNRDENYGTFTVAVYKGTVKTLDEKYLPYKTETWTFELEDGSTVHKQVVVK